MARFYSKEKRWLACTASFNRGFTEMSRQESDRSRRRQKVQVQSIRTPTT